MLSTRPRPTFGLRVFGAFALMTTVVSTAFTLLFIVAGSRRLEADLLERGRSVAGILATGVRTAVYAENAALAGDVLAGALEKPEVLAAAVFTADGRLLVAAGRAPAEREAVGRLGGAELAALREAAAPGSWSIRHSTDLVEIFHPVTLRGAGGGGLELFFDTAAAPSREDVIGHVRVRLDHGPVREELGRLVANAALLALLLLGGGAVVVFVLARRVTEPLVELTGQVRRLGAAGSAHEIPVRRGDEIGELAEAFNAMLRSLADREREKEQLEEGLRTARKMEAVGTLSRGIAHDFNNILSTVANAVHVLERADPGNELVLEYTRRIRVSIGSARELIDRLVTFSRAKLPERGPLDLAALVREHAPMLRVAVGEGVELVLDLPRDPVPVCGDADGLRQVLLNLCYNARDAMPEGGAVRVSVAAVPAGPAGPALARLTVCDGGAGIGRGVRDRIFEPFYSTKEGGRGRGLGLAIVHGIVEQHGGTISVDSEPGRGTSFTIDLALEAGGEACSGS